LFERSLIDNIDSICQNLNECFCILSTKKYDLPFSEDPNEAIIETVGKMTSGSQLGTGIQDKQPLLKHLVYLYFENGVLGVCEEIAANKSDDRFEDLD
jgi:hypothetical protein